MTLAMGIHATGGPAVLTRIEQDLPIPGAGEVRLRQMAIGVNFVDVYQRSGLYPAGFPAVLGVEGAGMVEAVGEGVEGWSTGDRAAYAGLPIGSYAEVRNIVADRLVRLPDAVDFRTAAATMLRGVTAHMLLSRIHRVEPGDSVLVHAAAGGLGLVLTAWAKSLGAVVIGTVGSPAKAELALSRGLDHAILYREADFVAKTRELTRGRGVDVAYDGIGGDTLVRTLDAVRPFGTVVSLGQAGGSLPSIPLAELGPKRSLSLARPSVLAYAADQAAYRQAAGELMARLSGGLSIAIGAELPLSEAARAHEMLESGTSTGSLLLIP